MGKDHQQQKLHFSQHAGQGSFHYSRGNLLEGNHYDGNHYDNECKGELVIRLLSKLRTSEKFIYLLIT